MLFLLFLRICFFCFANVGDAGKVRWRTLSSPSRSAHAQELCVNFFSMMLDRETSRLRARRTPGFTFRVAFYRNPKNLTENRTRIFPASEHFEHLVLLFLFFFVLGFFFPEDVTARRNELRKRGRVREGGRSESKTLDNIYVVRARELSRETRDDRLDMDTRTPTLPTLAH